MSMKQHSDNSLESSAEIALLPMQETALFEVGYRHNGVFERNPLVRVSCLPSI